MTIPWTLAALLGLTTAMQLAAAGGQVMAADLAGTCCVDLEERIADLEATSASKGSRKVALTISGLINQPVMYWNDGKVQDVFVVSDEVKRSRLRVSGQAKIDAAWSAGIVFEFGPNPSPNAPMDQFRYDPSAGHIEMRHVNWFLKNQDLGQLTVGLGSQALDSVTEISVANTSNVISPGLPIFLGYFQRGWFMRRDDGVLTGLRFGQILFKGRNDIWGEGHRWNVARYDSPMMAGFTASASWGENDLKDAALRYSGEVSGFKIGAALGIAEWTRASAGDNRGCAQPAGQVRHECWEVGGSASIMHLDSGLFLNVAAGAGKDNGVLALYSNIPGVDDTEDFYYGLAGIERQWFSLGKTTLFAQYWHKDIGAGLTPGSGTALDASSLGAGKRLSGADVSIWGVSLNQTLSEGVDVYASYNHVETDVRTSATGALAGSVTTNIAPFDFVLTGMAVRF